MVPAHYGCSTSTDRCHHHQTRARGPSRSNSPTPISLVKFKVLSEPHQALRDRSTAAAGSAPSGAPSATRAGRRGSASRCSLLSCPVSTTLARGTPGLFRASLGGALVPLRGAGGLEASDERVRNQEGASPLRLGLPRGRPLSSPWGPEAVPTPSDRLCVFLPQRRLHSSTFSFSLGASKTKPPSSN